ncbi:MAG: isoprenyl transferase [Candidatus Omnitrophota bacterium]|jgi:undecaprenyl diphosphate synthase|nr:isoprenyl transferase [Candidatus Omnitrophota bacterium]
MDVPKHIAIIMDGNGRWARKKHLPKIMGHREGVESLKEIVGACVRFGVRYLTVYAFSTENWLRPKKEVIALFGILCNFLNTQMQLFHKDDVKLCIIGDRDRMDPLVKEVITRSERETIDYKTLTLNVALSYGGRQEILRAVKGLSADVKKGVISSSEIDEMLFSQYLYTKDCPDPDLLIRTSGEMRISNFLLWQISYAEIYVTDKFWPDFREPDLKKAIEDYQKRDRRFGRRIDA